MSFAASVSWSQVLDILGKKTPDIFWAFLLGGLVAAFAAVGHRRRFASQRWRTRRLQESKITPAGEIRVPGAYHVQGIVHCKDPVVPPRCKRAVVWYDYVLREFWSESKAASRSVGGRRGVEQHHKERVVESASERVPFAVQDDSGFIPVDLEGANPIGTCLLKALRPDPDAPGFLGTFFRSLKQTFVSGQRSRSEFEDRVLALPVGCRVYVRGTVCQDSDGTLRFRDTTSCPLQVTVGTKSAVEKALLEEDAKLRGRFRTWVFIALSLLALSGFVAFGTVMETLHPGWPNQEAYARQKRVDAEKRSRSQELLEKRRARLGLGLAGETR